jgi:nucleoside-diphosphate-sugar epimerase
MNDFWYRNQSAKFLITGATGWFGRTLVDQLIQARIPFMCLGSHGRREIFSGKQIRVQTFDDALVQDFAPTIVADFAFLTRDKSEVMSPQEYANTNRRLTDQAISLAQIDSVRALITTSSGAAVHGKTDSYGQLKLEADERFRDETAKLDKSWVNIRAWSVSGQFVRNINGYAFSKFVHDAIFEEKISIESPHMVFRRYVDVGDLILVAIKLALGGEFRGTIDSGGELVELEQLAHRIFSVLQLEPKIDVKRTDSGYIDDYFSRSSQWEKECQRIGFAAKSLDFQILDFSKALAAKGTR